MGKPAAKKGDQVMGACTHKLMVQGVATPTPMPFAGMLDAKLSGDVFIGGQPAAVAGSQGSNTPQHPVVAATPFQSPPDNKATVDQGSATVLINGKGAARAGDPATICDELKTKGQVVAAGTVLIGG
ncbi:MAG TPA: PAAR domain-containing protein [Herpetosiphonaceae bacterium]